MEPLRRAQHDFADLADRLRQHGAPVDVSFDGIVDRGTRKRLRKLYEAGQSSAAKRLISGLLEQKVRSETGNMRRQAETLERKVQKGEEALSAWNQEMNAESAADFELSWNLQTLRQLFDLSKSALARQVDVVSRPTLVNIEDGGGARLSVVEAIADALGVPDEALQFSSDTIGTLYDSVRPLDSVQELLHAVVDDPNDAAGYARHRASTSRLDPETLRVIGDVLEAEDDAYDNRAARVGAALGWKWGIPPERASRISDEVTRDLVAGVLGGWWLHRRTTG